MYGGLRPLGGPLYLVSKPTCSLCQRTACTAHQFRAKWARPPASRVSSSHLFSSHRFLLSSLVWLIDQASTHVPCLITNEIVKIRPFQTYVFYTDSIYMAIGFVTLCDDCSRLQIWHSVNLVLLWKPGVRRCISKFEIWSSVEKVW